MTRADSSIHLTIVLNLIIPSYKLSNIQFPFLSPSFFSSYFPYFHRLFAPSPLSAQSLLFAPFCLFSLLCSLPYLPRVKREDHTILLHHSDMCSCCHLPNVPKCFTKTFINSTMSAVVFNTTANFAHHAKP